MPVQSEVLQSIACLALKHCTQVDDANWINSLKLKIIQMLIPVTNYKYNCIIWSK